MALINSLCAMYRATPFHQENYSRLILSVIIQFYQRCSDHFQTLVSTPAKDASLDAQVSLAARWAQRSELNPCLTELLATEVIELSIMLLCAGVNSHVPLGKQWFKIAAALPPGNEYRT